MSINPAWVVLAVLLIILFVKKGGGMISALTTARGALPAAPGANVMYIALAVLAFGIAALLFTGIVATPSQWPGTVWLMQQNGYVLGAILIGSYVGSYFLSGPAEKPAKVLRVILVGLFLLLLYFELEAKREENMHRELAILAQATAHPVSMVCGVVNTRPEYADYGAGDHGLPWHRNEVITMPRSSNETECLVGVMWDEADPSVHGTFEIECRGTEYLPWSDPLDPYGKTGNCNYFRIRSKGDARKVRFKFYAQDVKSDTN